MSFASTILVVDDNPSICTIMQCVLEASGYHVWTAHSGGEAMDVLVKHGHELHLLVTDVLMPDMSGTTLAKAAVQSFPGLRVLYVSGYCGNYGDQVPAASRLDKPFTAAELLERVHALTTPAGDTLLVH
jgi:CheY-like chemotaxis protein